MSEKRKCWSCRIGPVPEDLPHGSDWPMRRAVEAAYQKIAGRPSEFMFSGWNDTLTEGEDAYLSGRTPADPAAAIRGAREALEGAKLLLLQGRDYGPDEYESSGIMAIDSALRLLQEVETTT